MDIYGRPDSDANGLLLCPDWLDDLFDLDDPTQQPSQQPSQQLSQQDIYPF